MIEIHLILRIYPYFLSCTKFKGKHSLKKLRDNFPEKLFVQKEIWHGMILWPWTRRFISYNKEIQELTLSIFEWPFRKAKFLSFFDILMVLVVPLHLICYLLLLINCLVTFIPQYSTIFAIKDILTFGSFVLYWKYYRSLPAIELNVGLSK